MDSNIFRSPFGLTAAAVAQALGYTPANVALTPRILVPTLVATVGAKITGSTAEAIAAYVNIPGGLMGAGGSIELVPLIDSAGAASTVSGFLRIVTGTSAGTLAGTALVNGTSYGTTNQRFRASHEIYNNTAANVQTSWPATAAGGWAASGTAVPSAAIDTAAAFTVSLNLKLANGADSAWLLAMRVILWPRA